MSVRTQLQPCKARGARELYSSAFVLGDPRSRAGAVARRQKRSSSYRHLAQQPSSFSAAWRQRAWSHFRARFPGKKAGHDMATLHCPCCQRGRVLVPRKWAQLCDQYMVMRIEAMRGSRDSGTGAVGRSAAPPVGRSVAAALELEAAYGMGRPNRRATMAPVEGSR